VIYDVWSDAAAWVQAVGTIAAVAGAAWVAAGESRSARKREERSAAAAGTAALNLALLAAAQIHELHGLLRDETRRVRVTNVSPSRTLETTERMLTGFPIQTLNDASVMIAFSYFPGALAIAAEIYANLEAEVRAAPEAEHAEVFAGYSHQMVRLERAVNRHIAELRHALGLEGKPDAVGVGAA
jgi:hypothetical protein